jgi:hypothetical protein
MVQPLDVARAIHLVATMPQRTIIQELVIAPTRMRDTSGDLEISRWTGAPDSDLPPSHVPAAAPAAPAAAATPTN